MLRWRDVAEEIGSGRCSDSAANGCRDVIIPGTDISHQGPKDIERRPAAEPLLELDIGYYLVQRNVAWPLNHDLNTGLPGTIDEFSQGQQFLYLAAVGGIGQAPRTHAITQAKRYVMLQRNLQQAVVLFVKGVLLLIAKNPTQQEGSPSGYDVGEPALPPEMVN